MLTLAALALAGCGVTMNHGALVATPAATAAGTLSPAAIHGTVNGGRTAIAGASIQLYSMGTSGSQSQAVPLLASPVTTDAGGSFTIENAGSCPSAGSELYLVASGGNPGMAAGTNNQVLGLMTLLGPCNQLSATQSYPLNEVTTIASIWPLAAYMAAADRLGSSASDTGFPAAVTLVKQLANLAQAVSPGVGVPAGYAVQTAKLYSLANDLDACIVSRGGKEGDGSSCGQLLALATPAGGSAPQTTLQAALALAQQNQLSTQPLFQMATSATPFQPVLQAVPDNWNLNLVAVPAPPTILPVAGAYEQGQAITIGSSAANAAIHYTTDGTLATMESPLYSGPIALQDNETVQAVAVAESIPGATATAAFSIHHRIQVTITPGNATLSAGQTQAFTAAITGTNNRGVRWSVNPAAGSITGNGIYTAPATVASAQAVTITATSEADPAQSAHAQVSLQPAAAAVSVQVSPVAVSLSAGQTQVFTASISGSSNQGVIWSLSPAVGTISSAGLYTAPASVSSAQTVTVTATSTANGSKASHAAVTLTPSPVAAISVQVTPGAATLGPGQTQLFGAAVTGSTNTAVNWSLSPAVGTITAGGIYTAPASVATPQTVMVIATSAADGSKTAQAAVTLTASPAATVSVQITPGTQTLAPSQTLMFSATVSGTGNTAVNWSLSPAVGTITTGGLYTAPASIVGVQTVTVTAASQADSSKAASTTVWVTPQGSTYLTFYVDNLAGNDSNAGTNPNQPFATIAKVNSLNLQPGQTVAFKSGDTWHEMLTVAQSGVSGQPIEYTSYGSGAQPIIDASDGVTGWVQGAPGQTLPGYVWSRPQPADPLLINFAGQVGMPVASVSKIAAAQQFFWDGARLYVYATANPGSAVEAGTRTSALTSAGASYVNVVNLHLRGGAQIAYCGVTSPCSHWNITNNTFDSSGQMAIHWALNNNVDGGTLRIANNVFRGIGGSGISLANGGPAMGDVISGNTMTDLCKIYNSANQYCDAINIYSQTGADGGGQIINNTISEVGLTAGAAFGGGIHPDTVINWDVEHNTVSDTNYSGVELEKGSGSTARYNLLINAGQYNYAAGILIRAGEGLNVTNMVAEYNTSVGGWWACALGITPDNGTVTATNITISRNICLSGSNGTNFWLDPGYAAAGNAFSGNGFGVPGLNFVKAGNSFISVYSLLPSLFSGSIAGDPEFVSPSTGNYQLQPSSPDAAIGAFPLT